MIRVVLAVLLSVALLGIALPVVDTARVDHSDARARAEASRLAATMDAFTRQADPVRNVTASAVRMHPVRLPARSWGDSGVESFRIVPGTPGQVAWRVADGTTHRVRLPVAVATTPHLPAASPTRSGAPPAGGAASTAQPTRGRVAGEPLVLGAGRHRVRLRFVRVGNASVVVVDRPRINT